jgi:uncharacterized protein
VARPVVRFDEAGCAEDAQTVRRFDLAELRSPTRTKDGFLRAQGFISRSGVFIYRVRDADGGVREIRELRPESSVFSAESLESFNLVPLTLEHPTQNLSAQDAHLHQVGSVGSLERSGNRVKADILINRQDAIDAVNSGVRQLSCGYDARVVARGGVFTDENGVSHRFDAVQEQIRGNHVAIVARGRAGADIAMRLDSGDGVGVALGSADAETEIRLVKIKIGSKEFEVPDEVGEHLSALESKDGEARKDSEASDALKAEQAKNALLQGENEGLKVKLQEASSQTEANTETQARADEIRESVRVVRVAEPILGKTSDELISMGQDEVKRQVILKIAPKTDLERKDDAFVSGMFEALVSSYVDSTKSANLRPEPRKDDSGAQGKTLEEVNRIEREKSIEALKNAYKMDQGSQA